MKERIVLLGAPATGKGTQTELMVAEFGLPTASTGAMIRNELAQGTELGKSASEWTRQGKLFPNEIALQIVWSWLGEGNRFILDGFPRTLEQAEAFDQGLIERNLPLDRVYFLDLPDEIIFERVLGRSVCKKCQSVFNKTLHDIDELSPCPACGGSLERRTDDTPQTLARRLEEYRALTYPVVEHYRSQGVLLAIDAIIGRDRIYEIIRNDICE